MKGGSDFIRETKEGETVEICLMSRFRILMTLSHFCSKDKIKNQSMHCTHFTFSLVHSGRSMPLSTCPLFSLHTPFTFRQTLIPHSNHRIRFFSFIYLFSQSQKYVFSFSLFRSVICFWVSSVCVCALGNGH